MSATTLRRAVFLDRDGVINAAIVRDGKPYSPMSVREVRVLPGVGAACSRLRSAGFVLVAVTNQPEIARGRLGMETLEAIHEVIRREVPLDAIFVCPHDDADGCACRKPAPGLILDASETMGLDPTTSYCVGDRWKDIEAGREAGCTTVLVDAGYDEPISVPDKRVGSLPEAAEWIIEERMEVPL